MTLLVISDIHLKPWRFHRASELIKEYDAECAVCLMDIADDWGKQKDVALYRETYDAAINFAKEHPSSLWCYGNHDLSYVWHKMQSGYSIYAAPIVTEKIRELKTVLSDEQRLAYVHRIDDVLFSHGGVTEEFVRDNAPSILYDDTDAVIHELNNLNQEAMWRDNSPIWARPQYGSVRMYQGEKLLQVVGHTPVKAIQQEGNLISCDVFANCSDETASEDPAYLLLNTKTWEWKGVR